MDANHKKQELERVADLLRAAMREQKLTNKALASRLDIHESMVSQWVTARKPISEDQAVNVATLLQLDPAAISEAYRLRTRRAVVLDGRLAMPSPAAVSPDLFSSDQDRSEPLTERVREMEHQVYALNLAVGLLAGVMREHRPKEAADALRELMTVPAWMQDGVLRPLIRKLAEE
jgi:plasmid maintenance system antidote protein VapI